MCKKLLGKLVIYSFKLKIEVRSFNLPWAMQYIKFRGTLRPAARHAANDAEKLIAIIFPSSLPEIYKIYYTLFKRCT